MLENTFSTLQCDKTEHANFGSILKTLFQNCSLGILALGFSSQNNLLLTGGRSETSCDIMSLTLGVNKTYAQRTRFLTHPVYVGSGMTRGQFHFLVGTNEVPQWAI